MNDHNFKTFPLLKDALAWVEANVDSEMNKERFRMRMKSMRIWSDTETTRGRADMMIRVYFGSQGLPSEVAFAMRKTGEEIHRETV